ncbi:ChaB family protein, partial [Escherichia coli]
MFYAIYHHPQDIYKEAFNSAWDQYKDKDDRRDDASREETAHKVAWAAVKHEYAIYHHPLFARYDLLPSALPG